MTCGNCGSRPVPRAAPLHDIGRRVVDAHRGLRDDARERFYLDAPSAVWREYQARLHAAADDSRISGLPVEHGVAELSDEVHVRARRRHVQ